MEQVAGGASESAALRAENERLLRELEELLSLIHI